MPKLRLVPASPISFNNTSLGLEVLNKIQHLPLPCEKREEWGAEPRTLQPRL